MISRVAEHCFWMARYLERAENIARVLDVNQTLLLDFEIPFEQQWLPLLIISGIHDFQGEAAAEPVQDYMTWDLDNASSITSSISFARENARIIREVISADLWERINYYYLWIKGPAGRDLYERDRNDFYSQIKRINQLLFGIGEATMSHGEAWDFFKLGKYLERACQTGRILDVKYHLLLPTPEHVGTPIDNAQWTAILKSCSGYEPFHKQRVTLDQGVSVADFLIFDPIFPRSVRRCLWYCQEATQKISGKKADKKDKAQELLDKLVDWLNEASIEVLVRNGLHESLTRVINHIHQIGEAIHSTYFDIRHHPVDTQANGFFQTQSQG
jgi:uncharacterized alpha-E superfamily protein